MGERATVESGMGVRVLDDTGTRMRTLGNSGKGTRTLDNHGAIGTRTTSNLGGEQENCFILEWVKEMQVNKAGEAEHWAFFMKEREYCRSRIEARALSHHLLGARALGFFMKEREG